MLTAAAPSVESVASEPEFSPGAGGAIPTPIRRILLPLDGSPLGEQAVPVALAIARASGARVHAVHLYVPFPKGAHIPGLLSSLGALEQGLFEASRAYAELWTQTLARAPGVTAACEVVEASRPSSLLRESPPVTDALLDAAENHRVDLIVMTTHGFGGLSRAWLGSTADGVIRRARVPVLVIRPSAAAQTEARGLPQHILVPLDGSELADRVLGDVLALAHLGGARVTLLSVLVPRLAIARPAPVTRIDEADLARQRAEAERHLDVVAARCREQGVAAETVVVVGRHVASAILEHAIDQTTDLIAMTTHGRGGLRRLMLGSVADKVLRGAPVSVLVRHPEHPGGPTIGD
jgi:nucleotide-binding universal stress UspA family protein